MNKLTIAVTGAAFLLASCTTNPYTGEEEASKTAIGAGAGAAIGAATGGLLFGSRSSVLIGAGIGALTGGAIGAYMDREQAELRRRLQGTGVSVTRDGDQIILNMPGNVTFETGSSELRPNFYEVLNSVAIVLNEFDQTLVDVLGHTDSVGDAEYNMQLSQRRADNVAQYLISQGVMSQRIIAQGFGENQPIASNDTEDGRRQNRRVEIRISPLTADTS